VTEPQLTCAICGGTAHLKCREHPGFQEPTTYAIFECTRCKTSFANPTKIEPEVYESIYRQVDLIPGYFRYAWYADVVTKVRDPLRLLADRESSYWAIRQVLLESEDRDRIRVLDVGSGLGYLTYALNRAGWNTRGIDISEPAVRAANQRFGNYFTVGDAAEYSSLTDDRFDFIVVSELIEHLPDPVSFLDRLGQLLSDRGKIVITTPNRSVFSPQALWHTEIPPVHLWWFSEESMRSLASARGYRLNLVDFTRFNRQHGLVMKLRTGDPMPVCRPRLDARGNALTVPGRSLTPLKRIRLQLGLLPGLRRLRGWRRRIAAWPRPGRRAASTASPAPEDLRRSESLCAVFSRS
jgi:SAM-dependent methyltransferase